MKGLLIKDFLSIRRYTRYLLVLTLIFTVLTGYTGNLGFLAGFGPMCAMVFSLSVFSYDEYHHWYAFALSFPVNRRDLVRSRYLFNLIVLIATTGISSLIAVLLNAALQIAPWDEICGMTGGSLFSALCLLAFTCPAIYRFGVEKGRYMIAIAALLYMLVLVTVLSVAALPEPGPQALGFVFAGIFILALLLCCVSYRLSVRILSQKDL